MAWRDGTGRRSLLDGTRRPDLPSGSRQTTTRGRVGDTARIDTGIGRRGRRRVERYRPRGRAPTRQTRRIGSGRHAQRARAPVAGRRDLARGGEGAYAVCDVADPAQVEGVAETAVQRFGRIDTWANVAAMSVYARFEDTSPEEFRRVMEVNYLGQVYEALAALPRLRQAGGGALIAISSRSGESSRSRCAALQRLQARGRRRFRGAMPGAYGRGRADLRHER